MTNITCNSCRWSTQETWDNMPNSCYCNEHNSGGYNPNEAWNCSNWSPRSCGFCEHFDSIRYCLKSKLNIAKYPKESKEYVSTSCNHFKNRTEPPKVEETKFCSNCRLSGMVNDYALCGVGNCSIDEYPKWEARACGHCKNLSIESNPNNMHYCKKEQLWYSKERIPLKCEHFQNRVPSVEKEKGYKYYTCKDCKTASNIKFYPKWRCLGTLKFIEETNEACKYFDLKGKKIKKTATCNNLRSNKICDSSLMPCLHILHPEVCSFYEVKPETCKGCSSLDPHIISRCRRLNVYIGWHWKACQFKNVPIEKETDCSICEHYGLCDRQGGKHCKQFESDEITIPVNKEVEVPKKFWGDELKNKPNKQKEVVKKMENENKKIKKLEYISIDSSKDVRTFLESIDYKDIKKIVAGNSWVGIFYMKEEVEKIKPKEKTEDELKISSLKDHISTMKQKRIEFIQECLEVLRANLSDVISNSHLNESVLEFIKKKEPTLMIEYTVQKKKRIIKKTKPSELLLLLKGIEDLHKNRFSIYIHDHWRSSLYLDSSESWMETKKVLLLIKKYVPLYLIEKYGKELDEYSEGKKVCKGCFTELEDEAMYCSYCGEAIK